MKIYTKGGDKGETQVYADKALRLPKNADVLECYGTLDELNAHIGLLVSHIIEHKSYSSVTHELQAIQVLLFQIGFAISAKTSLVEDNVAALEYSIDEMQCLLAPQNSFILPGGCVAASQAHVCRTIARRAERRLVGLQLNYPVPEICLSYLNRLSDYLFVVARYLNHLNGINDIKL